MTKVPIHTKKGEPVPAEKVKFITKDVKDVTARAITSSTRISDSYTKYGLAFCVAFGTIAGYETAGAAEEAGE